MDPLSMLPAEMWEELLENIEDPLDKMNLVRTNSQLHNLFGSQIPEWHFASIMPIVLTYLHGPKGYQLQRFYSVRNPEFNENEELNVEDSLANEEEEDSENDSELEDGPAGEEDPENDSDPEDEPQDGLHDHAEFEQFMQQMARRYIQRDNLELFIGLRNCRAVSKLCLKTLDNFIKGHIAKFKSPPLFSRYDWGSREDVERFLEESKDLRTFHNPSLQHVNADCDIGIIPDEEFDTTPTYRQILDVVQRLGSKTQNLRVEVVLNSPNPLPICNFIQEALTSASNVRHVRFEFDVFEYLDLEVPPAPEILPLPDLPNLESLTLDEPLYMHGTGKVSWIPLCVNIKKYFPQLKRLSIGFHLWRDNYNHCSPGQVLFPLLMYLHVHNFDIWEDQEKLFGFLWNLNAPKLNVLDLYGDGPGDEKKHSSGIYLIKQLGLQVLKECSDGVDYKAIIREGIVEDEDDGMMKGFAYIYFTTDIKTLPVVHTHEELQQ